MQVLREEFENGYNKKLIDLMTFRDYQELFNKWKKAKKPERDERLQELRAM